MHSGVKCDMKNEFLSGIPAPLSPRLWKIVPPPFNHVEICRIQMVNCGPPNIQSCSPLTTRTSYHFVIFEIMFLHQGDDIVSQLG